MRQEQQSAGVLRRRQHLAQAALLLAGVLVVFSLPMAPRPKPRCDAPSEAAARDGLTTVVHCGRAGERGTALRGPARLLFGERLDVNRSAERALQVIPGIGPARAAAIVAGRPYRTVADLERLHGIGPRTVERMAGYLTVASEGVP